VERIKSTLKALTQSELLDLFSRLFFSPNLPEIAQIQCAICLEPMSTSVDPSASSLVQLNCDEGHIFHLKCLKQWAGKQ
jgi:hypothetical protein